MSESIAWAAGFFEGEGYFSLLFDKRRPHLPSRPYVGILNSDLEVLQQFAEIIEVGHISGPRARFVNRPLWTWQATGHDDVHAVVVALGPWLSERRLRRAAEVLARDEAYA